MKKRKNNGRASSIFCFRLWAIARTKRFYARPIFFSSIIYFISETGNESFNSQRESNGWFPFFSRTQKGNYGCAGKGLRKSIQCGEGVEEFNDRFIKKGTGIGI